MGCPWLAVGFRPLDDGEVPVRTWLQCQRHLTRLVMEASFCFPVLFVWVWIQNLPLKSGCYPFIFYIYSIPKILLLRCMALGFWTLYQPEFSSCLPSSPQSVFPCYWPDFSLAIQTVPSCFSYSNRMEDRCGRFYFTKMTTAIVPISHDHLTVRLTLCPGACLNQYDMIWWKAIVMAVGQKETHYEPGCLFGTQVPSCEKPRA